MAAKKTTKKRTARKAASKKRRSNKAPSAKQLAARAEFAAAAKARSRKAAKVKKNPRTTLTGKRGDRRLKTPTESHLSTTAGHWYSLGWSTKQVTDKLKTYGVTVAEAKRIARSARSVGRYVKGHLERNPKRARNKTVIVKPKRVLVINGKKKAAKKRNSATASQKVNRAGSKTVSKLKSIRTEFTGLPIRGTNTMNVSDKSPSTMAKLAQLLDLTLTDGRIIKPQAGTTWVCSDSKKKIHFATTLTRLFDGPAGDVGRVKLIGYRALKPSVGSNKIESYEHLFGEEGGKQPTLVSDGKGGLYLRGGSYIITQDGIIN